MLKKLICKIFGHKVVRYFAIDMAFPTRPPVWHDRCKRCEEQFFTIWEWSNRTEKEVKEMSGISYTMGGINDKSYGKT